MVRRYPHTMIARQVGASVQDSQGNWTTPTGADSDPVACRYEPNNKGALLRTEDGQEIVYAGVVWMKEPVTIPVGTPVKVFDGESIKASGAVRQMDRAQQTTRLWL